MKKFLPLLLAFSLVLAVSWPYISSAQTSEEVSQKIEETKRQRDSLLERQKQLQTALDQLSREGQTLQGTVKTLDAAKSKLENDLRLTQANITSSNLEIVKLGDDISSTLTEIADHRAAIKDSLKKLSGYDSHTVIFDLLAYRSLTDVWTDTSNLLDAQDALGSEINALEDSQKKLQESKAAKEATKSHLVSLSSELKGQKKVVEETKQSKVQLLAETKSKEVLYQQMLAENIAKEKEFEAQLFQYESQLKASDRTLVPTAARGVLSWPVTPHVVTQQFGRTSSSGRLYASGTHNGTDFRATVGTPVMAVRSGIVEAMGNTDDQPGCYSYGRWILIRHDNGLSSLYAHLSAAIAVTGQAVATGEVIGYSGGMPRAYGSGYSTGPHLHLGLFATAGVEVSRYTASLNCKNVSIPIANPQDYLDPLAYMPFL